MLLVGINFTNFGTSLSFLWAEFDTCALARKHLACSNHLEDVQIHYVRHWTGGQPPCHDLAAIAEDRRRGGGRCC